MADSSTVEVICPELELLTKVETNLTCPIRSCGKVLPNSSSLRMHLVKTHSIVSNAKESKIFDRSSCQNKTGVKKTLYCCPVENCVRGRTGGRPFSRLAHVKQHYMTVHGEKKFTCKICNKKFGRNDACLRHEKACGVVFPCSCGHTFNNRNSLLTHGKRNGHALPDKWKAANAVDKNDMKSFSALNSQPLCVSVLPVISKGVSRFQPLRPRKLLANAETQTDQQCFCATPTPSLVQSDKGITVDIPLPRSELNTHCEYAPTVDEVHTQTSFITGEQHLDMDFSIDNEEFKELAHSQTQTNWGLAFEGFPIFEDNETQTLESYLEIDASNITTDCATQTKNIFDDIFSVDNQTQTLFPGMNFVDEQFGGIRCSHGMDNETQTLQNIYLDTETSLIECPHGTAFNPLQNSSSNTISTVETQTS